MNKIEGDEKKFQKGDSYEALENYEAETYIQFVAGKRYLCVGNANGFVRFQCEPAYAGATPQKTGLRGETLKRIFGN